MTSRLTLVFCLFYFITVQAQVGSLDAGFSGDGKLTTAVNGGTDVAYGVVVQGNNRIIAVGLTRIGGNDNFAIVRYLEDGTLDNSFSNDGKVDIDFEGGNDEARDVLVLGNGNILVAGTAVTGGGKDFAFALLDPEGKLVNSFGEDGKLTINFNNTNDVLSRIALHGDRIYAVGSSISNDVEQYAIAAIKADGTMENAFSGDGKLVFDVDAGQDVATAIAIQSDDKLLVAGYTGIGFEKEFCVVRFKSDGSLDNSFSGDGIAIPDVGMIDDRAYGIAIQDNQKIVVAGSSYGETGYDFALVRLLMDGNIDIDFGEDGYTVETIGPFFDDARDMVLQPDGKILVTGYAAQAASDADFGLARFTRDGVLDNTFSGDGKVITIIGSGESEDEAHAIALQPDGKIVIAGEGENSSGNVDFALARYISGIVTAIDQDGIVLEQLKLFPVPAHSTLNASFSINRERVLEFSITDIAGRVLAVVQENKSFSAGHHTLSFNLPASISPATYFLCVKDEARKKGSYIFLTE